MSRRTLALLVLGLITSLTLEVTAATEPQPLDWPEEQRAFFQDGPGLLLSEVDREQLLELDDETRGSWIETFLDQDPIPETPQNELREGIRRRSLLVQASELSPRDQRAQLLFLHGTPAGREVIDCGVVFKPMELWTFGSGDDPQRVVIFQPRSGNLFRLWLPLDSKRALYTSEMEYFLEQWEELRGFISGRRFDRQVCKEARLVDRVTGVDGLFGYEDDRPTNGDILALLAQPDLAGWARAAATTTIPDLPETLETDGLEVQFPPREGQRLVTRFTVRLPAEGNFEASFEGEEPELDLSIAGRLEQGDEVFDTFRVRFKLEVPDEPMPVALVADRPLRAGSQFLLDLVVRDEVGGAEMHVSRVLTIPNEPEAVPEQPVPEGVIVALGEQLATEPMPGLDSLVLVPPESDVVLGLWRAEALVTGANITKVVFKVDGQAQLTRSRPPFSAELRLSQFPTEQIIRAEGYNEDGELVAHDEVVVNQPRGALRVRIIEPRRGSRSRGEVAAKVEVVVPEERRVEKVEFLVDDVPVETLESPPWETRVQVPEGSDLSYLTVVAELDDGSRAEDVRFLTAPEYLEEVEVNLVELFTTVTDRSGGLVTGLGQEDFEVFEDGKPQEIAKFELVEDLPLTLGVTLDTSGSMASALFEAQRAAVAFLENIITRRDSCFAISFSDRPLMLMPPTNDVGAVETALEGLRAVGFTSLHDAVVHSLYYFRGIRGRRAMVLLSDGDDTSSNIPFREALEYARRSGVAIYTIGLDVGALDLKVRDKLKTLSQETGGRHFFVKTADELAGIYDQIEEELRSQYLVAFNSNQAGGDGGFRTVEVKVKRRGLKARTVRGYYE